MRSVQLERAGALGLGDPGERPQVRQADFHAFALHVEKGRSVERAVPAPDCVAGTVEHPYPVRQEPAFAGLGVIELSRQRGRAAAAQAGPITTISPTFSWLTANSSAAETPWKPRLVS